MEMIRLKTGMSDVIKDCVVLQYKTGFQINVYILNQKLLAKNNNTGKQININEKLFII